MKWNEAAIVLLDPVDRTTRVSAAAWRDRYQIPPERSFSLPYPSGGRLAGEVPPGFTALGPSSLSFSGLETKVMVVSHGVRAGLALSGVALNGGDVAALLAGYGLREAGLLAFKACWLGKSPSGCLFWRRAFLDQLLTHLSRRDIGVGWLIGYKNVSRTHVVYIETPTVGLHAHAFEAIGPADEALRSQSNGRLKLGDDERVRVLRGNRCVVPPKGQSPRYSAL